MEYLHVLYGHLWWGWRGSIGVRSSWREIEIYHSRACCPKTIVLFGFVLHYCIRYLNIYHNVFKITFSKAEYRVWYSSILYTCEAPTPFFITARWPRVSGLFQPVGCWNIVQGENEGWVVIHCEAFSHRSRIVSSLSAKNTSHPVFLFQRYLNYLYIFPACFLCTFQV